MKSTPDTIEQLLLLLNILQNVDVGLVVLDRDCKVQRWNRFMENHSNTRARKVIGKDLFECFPELPGEWLKSKVDSVFMLNNRAFTTWKQRPYLLKFSNYRPITSQVEWMYQNLSLFPLQAVDSSIAQVCMIITDVTESALDDIALQALNDELDLLSKTDGLTRLLNRRSWEAEVEKEFLRFARSGRASSLVMLDIDHFKRVNDTYGHQAGDEVIRQISATIRKTQRDTDISGRYGGEEFGVILVESDAEGASYFCERLRAAVEDLHIVSDEHEIHCTISLGISEISQEMTLYRQWVEQSDQALYPS
ncbi:MAG: diguanylate cyclase [Candidatus Sedimenticola endophacoides]